MAWRHRNDPHQHHYHQHNSNHQRPTGYGHNTMSSGYSRPFSGHSNYPHSTAAFFRPSSPSVTTSSSDDREEVPMVRHPPRRPYSRGSRLNHHGGSSHSLHHAGLGHLQTVPSIMDNYHMHPMHGGPGPNHMGTFRNGTLRSTRSVPALALATWDGEPCPVHGGGPPVFPPSGPPTMRRYGSLFDVRGHGGPPMLYPPPPPSVMLDKKSMHGSMQMLAMPFPPHGYPPPSHQGHGPPSGGPFPPHFLAPTLMRGRPMVIPAGAEPLPIRDPFKLRTPPPQFVAKMDEDDYTMDQVCCKGHLIVLWIILGVVTVGVILGIILGVTIA